MWWSETFECNKSGFSDVCYLDTNIIGFSFAVLLSWTAADTTNKDHSFRPLQQQGHVNTNTHLLTMAAIPACHSLCDIVSSLCLAARCTLTIHQWSRCPLLWWLRLISLALLSQFCLLSFRFSGSKNKRKKENSDPARSGHPDPGCNKRKSEDNEWNFWCKVLILNSTLHTKGLIIPEVILIPGANEQNAEMPSPPQVQVNDFLDPSSGLQHCFKIYVPLWQW